jgi:hypothetical protein
MSGPLRNSRLPSASPLPQGEGPGVRGVAGLATLSSGSDGRHTTCHAPHPSPLPGGEGARKFGTFAGWVGLVLIASPALADDKPPAPVPSTAAESVQDLIFLGDNRPIFLRLRMTLGSQPFRTAWMDSVKAMHAYLDRDGDGKVSKEEADRGALTTLVRVANGGGARRPPQGRRRLDRRAVRRPSDGSRPLPGPGRQDRQRQDRRPFRTPRP